MYYIIMYYILSHYYEISFHVKKFSRLAPYVVMATFSVCSVSLEGQSFLYFYLKPDKNIFLFPKSIILFT